MDIKNNNESCFFSLFLYRFYSHVEGHEPAVLIIKTRCEEVILDD